MAKKIRGRRTEGRGRKKRAARKRTPKFQHPVAHKLGHVAPSKAESRKAAKTREKAHAVHVKKLNDRQKAIKAARGPVKKKKAA